MKASNWAPVSSALLLVSLALAHCGGQTASPGGGTKSPDGGGGGGGIEAGTQVGPCSGSHDCPTGSSCYWPIGSCSAAGECIENPNPNASECDAIEILCGCGSDAGEVYSGCTYPEGYASGPTTGEGSCGGVSPPPPVDGGVDATEGPPDASDDGGIEAGTPVGPCAADGDCPSGSSCQFPIGSCAATGECIEGSSGGGCGAVEILCGCGDAGTVYSGCGFASGYASGPTTGAGSCGTAPPPPGMDAG